MPTSVDNNAKSIRAAVALFMKLLPRPALLSSENIRRYVRMLHDLAETLQCRDHMELVLAKDVLDETWNIIRLRNAANATINGRANNQRAAEELRRKRQKNEDMKREVMSDVDNDLKDEKTRTSAFTEMSEWIYTLTTREADYEQEIWEASALESSIDYQLKLNLLIDAAMKRRNDALKQIEWYRKAFAVDMRSATDAVIEAATPDISADSEYQASTDDVSIVPEG